MNAIIPIDADRNVAAQTRQLDHEEDIPRAYTAKEMEEDYRKFVLTDFSKTAFDLHRLYPSIPKYRVYPGEVVVFIGDTGLGKTAFVQNLVMNLKMKTLWLSLENHATLQYRRFIQIAHDMSEAAVLEYYSHNSNALSKAVSHITSVFVPPKLSAMKRLISCHDPRIVVVDTLDGIAVEGVKDPVLQVEKSIIQLKGLAQELNVIIMAIHHIPKSATVDHRGNRKRLTKHSGKGSSSVEQKADKVIAIEGDDAGEIREVRSVKARDAGPFTQFFHFNKETFRYTAISSPPPPAPRLAKPTTIGVRLVLRKAIHND